MPLKRVGSTGADESWELIIARKIDAGDVLPIVSNTLVDDLVWPDPADLLEAWADHVKYPFRDVKGADGRIRDDLPRICQYTQVIKTSDPQVKDTKAYIQTRYHAWLKDLLTANAADLAGQPLADNLAAQANLANLSYSECIERLQLPAFPNPQDDPLLLLADMKLPIYVTTSYHTLLEAALRSAGAAPRSEVCRWKDELRSLPTHFPEGGSYTPKAEEPLVFHLFGVETLPESMVLTEDDHLEFLYKFALNRDRLPAPLRDKLGLSIQALLGYRLQNWDFRTLFLGLIKPTYNPARPKSVAIQVPSGSLDEWTYFERYLAKEAQYELVKGTTTEFLQKIHAAWQGLKAPAGGGQP